MIEHDFRSRGENVRVFIQEGKTEGTKPNEIPWKQGKIKHPKDLIRYLMEEVFLE